MGRPRCCGILAYPFAVDNLGYQYPRDPGGHWRTCKHANRRQHVRNRGHLQLGHVVDCWVYDTHSGTKLQNPKEKVGRRW
jgi:hypothetical protein